MGQHTSKRLIVSIPLNPGSDDDLLEWVGELAEGKRAPEIKKMLRLALFGVQPEERASATAAPAPDGLLREMQDQQARTVKWMEDWIKFFQGEIETMKSVGFTPNGTATVEAAPQMDEDDAARLAAKMKKAKW
jgi:hypothetical protein